jgi:hypothetical protein
MCIILGIAWCFSIVASKDCLPIDGSKVTLLNVEQGLVAKHGHFVDLKSGGGGLSIKSRYIGRILVG